MEPLPHHYEVDLTWSGDSAGLLSHGRAPRLSGGPPTQYDGRDDWWSPEHLLLASVSLCLMTTFRAFARRASLELKGYEGRARGVVEKTKEGPVFTRIQLALKIRVPVGAADQARETLASAKRWCLISNSVKAEVTIDAEISNPE